MAKRQRSRRAWRVGNIILVAIWIAVVWVAVNELRDGGLDRPGGITPTTTDPPGR